MVKNNFDKLQERQAKVQAQEVYCINRGLPNFIGNGRCYGCGCNVFDYITLEEAKNDLITGCPRCHQSMCD